MRIAIDARELCGHVTGVGRYLSHLIHAWHSLPEALPHEFTLYAPSGPAGHATGAAGLLREEPPIVRLREVPGGSGTWWEQRHLPAALRRDRPDVLFAPAYTAPLLTAVPVVLTLHDLSFVAHPEWFPPRSRMRRRLVTACAARRARSVLTDSGFQRTEVVDRLGVAAGKVRVIPLGLARVAIANRARDAAGTETRPDRDPLVLFVGSVFNRRHLPELIQAFARAAGRHPELRLEIVGDNRTYPVVDLAAVAAAAGVAPRVGVRDYVPDDALADLYARAGVFAFLSDYEGFGLTPLEALAAGVPILVGDTLVAREVYGDAAVFVPTTDVEAISAGLERLLFDPGARSQVLERASAVLGRYSWERAGRETLAALVEASRG